MAKKKPAATKVDSIRHKDKRKNIPTEELRDFVAADEHAPQTMLQPRDPPYGIKFGSNWQVSTRKRDVKDGKAEDVTRQPEQIQAFRDTWKLGVNSYLAWLRDGLVVARELLTETGSVFVQIGDENVHLV